MTTTRVLEIRTYRLHPGRRDAFHRLLTGGPLAELERLGFDVVAYGPSLVDEDGAEEYYLMRAFDSLAERDRLEAAFYGGAAWRERWRDAALASIESYHTIVVQVPDRVIAGLRTHPPNRR